MKAFPHTYEKTIDGDIATCTNTGMDLRDWFAGQALQGLTFRPDGFDFVTFPNDPMRVAHWAYDIADQMMKAREKKDE